MSKRDQVMSALRAMADLIESDHRLPIPCVSAEVIVPLRDDDDGLAVLSANTPGEVMRHAGSVLPNATQQTLWPDEEDIATARIVGTFSQNPLVRMSVDCWLSQLDGVEYPQMPTVTVPNFIGMDAGARAALKDLWDRTPAATDDNCVDDMEMPRGTE